MLQVLQEGTPPHLDVEHEGGRAAGHLLAHDAGGDEPVVLDRRRDVAQGVEDAVGRHETLALADDGDADALELAQELALG